MDNREFDNLFAEGLKKTQSFEGAEAAWDKLQPKLNPPGKRRRFLLWAALLGAAVFLLSVTTYWYYQQSKQLKQEVNTLHEQLQKQHAKASTKTATPETASSAQPNTTTEVDNNSSAAFSNEGINRKSGADSPNNQPIPSQQSTINLPPENSHNHPITDLSIATTQVIETQVAQQPKDNLILPSISQSQMESGEILEQSESIKHTDQLDFILALLRPLAFDRATPLFALDWDEATAEEEAPIKLSRWTLGINAAIAQSARTSGSSLEFDDVIQSVSGVSFDDGRFRTDNFYQLGIHCNFILNRNWLLQGALVYERRKQFVGDLVLPSGITAYEGFDNGILNANSTFYDTYNSTELQHKTWLLDVGINRRVLSLKKVRVNLGVHAMARLIFSDLNYYEGFDSRGSSIRGRRTLPLTFSFAPSLGLAGPIGKRFYWQAQSQMFTINIKPKVTLPRFNVGIGLGYQF